MMIAAWNWRADGIRRPMEAVARGTPKACARAPAGCSLSAARRNGTASLTRGPKKGKPDD